MNKSIELTQLQIKALENDASILIIPMDGIEFGYMIPPVSEKNMMQYAPLQIGDTDIYIKDTDIKIKECIDIKIVRVKDINTAREMENILGTNFISKSGHICIEEFNILIERFNELYHDNDYVFLIEVSR